jgi:biotin operon repressor
MEEWEQPGHVPGIDNLIWQLKFISFNGRFEEPTSAEHEWDLKQHGERVRELEESILDEWYLLQRLWNETLESWNQLDHERRVRSTWDSWLAKEEAVALGMNYWDASFLPTRHCPDLTPPKGAKEWTRDAMPTCFCLSAWNMDEDDWNYYWDQLWRSLRRMKSWALLFSPEEWIESIGAGEVPESTTVRAGQLTPTQREIVDVLLETQGLSNKELCNALGKSAKGLNQQIRKLKQLGLVVHSRGYWLKFRPKGMKGT